MRKTITMVIISLAAMIVLSIPAMAEVEQVKQIEQIVIPYIPKTSGNLYERLRDNCKIITECANSNNLPKDYKYKDACISIKNGSLDLSTIEAAIKMRKFENLEQVCKTPPENDRRTKAPRFGSSTIPLSISPGTGSAGSLETRLIEGMADFVIKRSKAELVFMLETNLKDQLCSTSEKGIGAPSRDYFPNLCAVLDTLDSNMPLQAMGTSLQAAAQKDLENLPDVAIAKKIKLANCNTTDAKCKEQLESLTAARIGFAMLRESRKGRSPLDILRSLSEMKKLDCEDNDKCAIPRLVRTISIMVRAVEREDNLQQAFNSNESNYAIASIVASIQELRENINKKGLNVMDIKWNELQDVNQVTETVKQFNDIISTSEDLFKQSKSKNASKEDILQIRIMVAHQGLEILDNLIQIGYKFTTSAQDPAYIQTGLNSLGSALEFTSAYFAQDIGRMSLAATSLISDLLPKTDNTALNDLRKYLPLITEFANAKSSEEVATILETAAAPVGSYRVKYEHGLVSINAFLGVGGGCEFPAKKGYNGNAIYGSFVSPVGLQVAWPNSCCWNKYLGVLVPIIDIGPYLSLEGKEKDINVAPNLSFKQVFAPGVYFTLGPWKKTPLAFGFGGSYTPFLEVTGDGTPVATWRAQAFIAVDIPIFPLASWGKKTKPAGNSCHVLPKHCREKRASRRKGH